MLESQERAIIRTWPTVVGRNGPGSSSLERFKLKVVGKPYEGEPHVRFEVAGDGNQDMDELLRHSQRKQGATDRLGLRPRRHSLTLPGFGLCRSRNRFRGSKEAPWGSWDKWN